MDKQNNITPAYNLGNAKSTGPYKLEKKGKALDQVEGPGHNVILSIPSSSQYGDE
jgi:hypothetical protein